MEKVWHSVMVFPEIGQYGNHLRVSQVMPFLVRVRHGKKRPAPYVQAENLVRLRKYHFNGLKRGSRDRNDKFLGVTPFDKLYCRKHRVAGGKPVISYYHFFILKFREAFAPPEKIFPFFNNLFCLFNLFFYLFFRQVEPGEKCCVQKHLSPRPNGTEPCLGVMGYLDLSYDNKV